MIFVDGSAWIAVMHQKDQYHQSAAIYFGMLLESGERPFQAISQEESKKCGDVALLWHLANGFAYNALIKN